MTIADWSTEAPKEPGTYWFFGDPYMGSMGGHYKGTVKPDLELHLVNTHALANGTAFVCSGHFMPSHKWDGKREGWLGVWKRCVLPDTSYLSEFIKAMP